MKQKFERKKQHKSRLRRRMNTNTKQLMKWDDDHHESKTKITALTLSRIKTEKEKSVDGTRLKSRLSQPKQNDSAFFLFLLLLLLITFWCLCLLFFLTFFDYQPIIKTSILSCLIACSHLILCCRRRRCVLSLLRRFRVSFYRFRYKVCRFVFHFFWSGFSFIQLKIMSHWQRQW